MQGWPYGGGHNLCGNIPCLHSHTKLVEQFLISREASQDLFSYWLNFAWHRRECHDRLEPNFLDNLFANRARPSIWSTGRSIQLLLVSKTYFLQASKSLFHLSVPEKELIEM